MFTDSRHLTLYLLAKLAAYTIWCAFGIQLLWSFDRAKKSPEPATSETSPEKKWLLASAYGLFRMLMGVFFGVVIWIVGTLVAGSIFEPPHHDLITYFLVYVPVRWVEWTILAWIMARNARKKIGYAWRFGGIAISCLADIPLIAATGWTLPLGRFFC